MQKRCREYWELSNQCEKEMISICREYELKHNISDTPFWILYVLHGSREQMPQTDICNSLYQPRQSTDTALKKLEADGYSLFIIPSGFSQLLQFFGRNDHVPVPAGAAAVVSTACSIFLDRLFIFPLQMGTMGAALATGISQCIALTVLLTHFLAEKCAFRFGFPNFDGRTMKDILANGLPACIGQSSPSVMTLCMNQVLIAKIGGIAVNAFSVISYIASFTVAVFNGISDGLQPLFGQSCGEKNEKISNTILSWVFSSTFSEACSLQG